ncbi:suppressor of fused domain protein [Pseudonocardiaceae bacterium YIM PH 21723]|nr:suppressor of fused domain protein [Pseudonocardiaceae bacterium YIM PH 21723]
MLTGERFTGFLDHVKGYLGPVRETESATTSGVNRGYALFFCAADESGLISVVTNGLRYQPISSRLPQELVCTLRHDQRQAAHHIASATAQVIIEFKTGLSYDQVVLAPAPLLQGTQIQGIIAAPHPYADAGFETLRDSAGQLALQILTLVPLTAAEGQLAQQRGSGELYKVWEEQSTNLLDVTRPSAV